MGAQRRQRQRRVGAGRKHELHRRGQVLDEPGDVVHGRSAGQAVEVIEHEAEPALLDERIDQPRQDHLLHGRRGDRIAETQRRDGRARAADRLDDVRPQDHRVVVALVERHPCHRALMRLDRASRCEECRPAKACRACHKHQASLPSVPQPPEQALARDSLRRDHRRMQFRQEDDWRLRTAGRVGFQCHRCAICREDPVLVNWVL